MLIKTRGIIFRAIKYSETSIIADIYTEAKGLQSYIISGVRKPRSKVSAGLLQVMSLVDMVAYFRENKELHRIKEIKAAHIYTSLPFEVTKSAVGLFMAELARKTIRESEEHPELFSFLFDYFRFLDKTHDPVRNIHLHFMLNLTTFLGFWPGGVADDNTRFFDKREGIFVSEEPRHIYALSAPQSALLSALLQVSLEQSHTIRMERPERQELLKHLLEFYQLHIDNFPTMNAHLILQEVL